MEDGSIKGLNPCSNGIQKYNQLMRLLQPFKLESLNPCSNGIQKYWMLVCAGIGILGLNPCSNGIQKYII